MSATASHRGLGTARVGPAPARRARPVAPAIHPLVALQQAAGNRATAVAVQRHNSYEHELMGDAGPKDVARIVAGLKDKAHTVSGELKRTRFFKFDATADPRDRFPDVRWIRLRGSQLWVSSGELSALADYLPNPDTIDSLPKAQIVPVLQRMRQDIADALTELSPAAPAKPTPQPMPVLSGPLGGVEARLQAPAPDPGFAGAAATPGWTKPLPGAVQQVESLDRATAGLGNNRQKGLLARNACHFPPFSWERWALFHNEARAEAEAWHRIGQGASGTPHGMDEHERKAWVNSSYSKHFLQDSFAAGHLINKTLVMQWFLEYNAKLPWRRRPSFGLPRDDVMKHMTVGAQGDIAGEHIYKQGPRLHTTAGQDKASGTTEADPQTTEERRQGTGRLAGSGVKDWGRGRALAYAEYSELLNSSYISLAANAAHDHFNAMGLTVRNQRGGEFRVGGDASLLDKSDDRGIKEVLEANQKADAAIDDIIRTGSTAVTQEEIFSYFPTVVVVEKPAPGGAGVTTTPMPLAQWNEQVLKKVCFEQIFPAMDSWIHAERWEYIFVRAQGPRLVESPSGSLGGGVMDLPVAK